MSQSRATLPARLPLLMLLGVVAAVSLLGLSAAEELVRYLPDWVRLHPFEWAVAAILAGYGLIRLRHTEWARGLDAASSPILRKWLSLGLLTLAVVWLAIWIPHYFYWPWSRDVDAFAMIARSWDAGELPYRDVRGYNFPGHIYLHWLLGKAFGWGRPGAFYGLDAALLLTLGGVVLAWSRRCFGNLLPGAVGYLGFLGFYLDANFEVVAERDWHATLGAMLGILVIQASPGRRGRWLSAFLTATAFTIRPHVVLFLPALFDAVFRSESGAWSRTGARRALEWAGALAVFVTLGFAPLLVAGVLDDLVRDLRIASYGGPYSTFTPARGMAILIGEIQRPSTAALLLALAFLSVRAPVGPVKASPRTWILAVLGALAYRPLHPVDHQYVLLPLALISATAWAIPVAASLRGGLRPFPALVLIAVLLHATLPLRFPYNCDLGASLDSIRASARSEWPDLPPGGWIWFGEDRQPFYRWNAYNRLLRYVRTTTGLETVVANVLKNPPFPAVNGPTGRRSPFQVESGIAWVWLVDQDLDAEFARQLEQAGDDSIVVWAPSETIPIPRLELKRLNRVIRDDYEPEARFGLFEAWRRKPKTSARAGVQFRASQESNSFAPRVTPP